jgi:hypothetical protein
MHFDEQERLQVAREDFKDDLARGAATLDNPGGGDQHFGITRSLLAQGLIELAAAWAGDLLKVRRPSQRCDRPPSWVALTEIPICNATVPVKKLRGATVLGQETAEEMDFQVDDALTDEIVQPKMVSAVLCNLLECIGGVSAPEHTGQQRHRKLEPQDVQKMGTVGTALIMSTDALTGLFRKAIRAFQLFGFYEQEEEADQEEEEEEEEDQGDDDDQDGAAAGAATAAAAKRARVANARRRQREKLVAEARLICFRKHMARLLDEEEARRQLEAEELQGKLFAVSYSAMLIANSVHRVREKLRVDRLLVARTSASASAASAAAAAASARQAAEEAGAAASAAVSAAATAEKARVEAEKASAAAERAVAAAAAAAAQEAVAAQAVLAGSAGSAAAVEMAVAAEAMGAEAAAAAASAAAEALAASAEARRLRRVAEEEAAAEEEAVRLAEEAEAMRLAAAEEEARRRERERLAALAETRRLGYDSPFVRVRKGAHIVS